MEVIAVAQTPVWVPSGVSYTSNIGIFPISGLWTYEHHAPGTMAKIWSVREEQVVAYYSGPKGKHVTVNWSMDVPSLIINGSVHEMDSFCVSLYEGVPHVSVIFDSSVKKTDEMIKEEWHAWVLDDVAIQMRLLLKHCPIQAQMGMIDVSLLSCGGVFQEVGELLHHAWESLSALNVDNLTLKRVYGVISFLLHISSGKITEYQYVHHLLDLFVLCGWETATVAVLVQKALGLHGSILRSQNPSVVAQMGTEQQSIVSLVFCVLSMLYFGVLPRDSDSKGFLKTFGEFGNAARTFTGCDGAIRVCIKALKAAYEWCEERVTGVSVSMKELVNVDATLAPWIDSVYELFDEFKKVGHLVSEDEKSKALELLEKGRKFKKDLSLLKLPAPLWNTFLEVFLKAERMDAYRAQSSFLDSPRVPPLVVWLYGDTSVGKSTLVNFLSVDLLTMSGQCDDAEKVFKHIFVRNCDTDFWDGYNPNHKVVVYDDFSAKIPSGEKVSQLMEIIQCANIMPMPLHVAELEEKKSARFKSELVFITSNLQNPDMREMNCPEAILRRRDFVVRVAIKQEFLKPSHKQGTGRVPCMVLDKEKVASVYGTQQLLHTDVYKFQLENNMSGEVIGGWMSYEALRDTLLQSYKSNLCRGTRYIEEMRHRAKTNLQNLQAQMGDVEIAMCYRELVERFQQPFTRIQALTFLTQTDALLDEDPPYKEKLMKMKGVLVNALASSSGLMSDGLDITCTRCVDSNFLARGWHAVSNWYQGSNCPHQRLMTRDEMLSEVRSYVPRMLSFARRNALSIALGAAIASLTVWIVAGKSQVKSPIDQILEAQSMYERDYVRTSQVARKKFKIVKHKAQYGKHVEDTLTKMVKKNQFIVYCERTKKSVNAIFVQGKACLMPLHFLEHLNEGEKIIFSNKCVGTYAELYCVANVVAMEGADVALYRLACELLPTRPSVLALFVRDAELNKVRRGDFVMQYLASDTVRIQARGMALEEIFDQESEPVVYRVPGGTEDIKLLRGHVYFAHTREGQCGSVVICANEGLHGCVVGIHVAGTASNVHDMGFSALTTYEMVDSMLAAFQEIDGPDCSLPLSMDATPRCQMGDLPYEHVGVLQSHMMMTGMVKTMLRPSPIFDMVQTHTTEPARLKPFTLDGVRISPMMEGMKGIEKVCEPMDPKLLQSCIESVADMIYTAVVFEDLNKITEEEAINGIPGRPYYDAINMGSSPGFPIVKYDPGSGKRRLFQGELPCATVGNGILRDELSKIDSALEARKIPETYFVCTLKDERRSKAKVEVGKTRVFAASNVAHVIRFREYFLPFAAAYMKHRAECEHAIGIDVYSPEWEMLFASMKQRGSNWMALDFSAFDKSITSQMMWSVWKVIEKVFVLAGVDEGLCDMKCLFGAVAEPRYIIYNDVWQMARSHPSGEPMTAVLNSILVSILYRYCFVQMARESDPEKACASYMARFVKVCSYGDDNIATVHPSATWFNQVGLASEMSKIGMTMTPALKQGELTPFECVDSVTFLKRRWRWSAKHGMHVPLRDAIEIVEMVNWVRTGNDPEEQLLLNVDDALYELHFHGVEVYNRYRSKFSTALMLMSVKHNLLSYAEQVHTWNERYRK